MASPILVVDDSPTQLEALRSLIADAGLEVQTAGSGEEAFEAARTRRPELVLSDVVMPGMSGFDLCRAIKEAMGEDAPAVVLLTSLADPRDIVRGLEAGADNYITKPYEPAHLIQRVRWVLENRALRREGQRVGGLRMRFMGEEFTLQAAPEQMLEMLLGSFEELAHTNRALQASQKALADAAQRELEHEQRAREEAEHTAHTMEQLARAAEAATRARDEVLATVSHDLKNPVGTIYTSASLLLEIPLSDELRERQHQIIKRTAERMNRLIQDLLDVSRMEAGRFSVDTRP
ncbi:MAG: hybrid sensor histidine kinase/response regulator, partial [Longimicrobiales bacterium]